MLSRIPAASCLCGSALMHSLAGKEFLVNELTRNEFAQNELAQNVSGQNMGLLDAGSLPARNANAAFPRNCCARTFLPASVLSRYFAAAFMARGFDS